MEQEHPRSLLRQIGLADYWTTPSSSLTMEELEPRDIEEADV